MDRPRWKAGAATGRGRRVLAWGPLRASLPAASPTLPGSTRSPASAAPLPPSQRPSSRTLKNCSNKVKVPQGIYSSRNRCNTNPSSPSAGFPSPRIRRSEEGLDCGTIRIRQRTGTRSDALGFGFLGEEISDRCLLNWMPCRNYVLGHYPGYVNLGGKLCQGESFNVPATKWNQLTPQQQWALNQAFLKRIPQHPSNCLVFSHAPSQARRGSWFYYEIRYLKSLGVSVSPVQDAYVP